MSDYKKLPGVIWAEPDINRIGVFITCLDKCEHGHTEPYFSADKVEEMIDDAIDCWWDCM